MSEDTTDNLPPLYPLQSQEAKYDYKLSNPSGKLAEFWLQDQYRKLSLTKTRENRKRNWDSESNLDSETYEKEQHDTEDDMMSSDTELNISVVSGNSHPPKRRLMSTVLSPTNEAKQITTTNVSNGTNIHARTPTGMNSSTNTPISDIDDQPQQLPLPSPSASPISGSLKQDVNEPVENMLSTVPETQADLIQLMRNLSTFLTEKNHHYLIFKLLQNVDRSALSSFSNLIQSGLARDFLSNLPAEITYNILSQLDYKTLFNVSLACSHWYKILNNSDVWINLLKKDHLMISDEEIQNELANPEQLIKEWGTPKSNNKLNVSRILYKKRKTIYNRWMNPKYEPKRISINIPSPGNNVVTCLQHDKDKIISGVDDKLINIYSTKTGELMKMLKGHDGGVWALKYTGNTLVSGSTDRTVRVWNIKSGKCTHIFRGHTSTVRCLDILHPVKIGRTDAGEDIIFPKEPLLVTGSRDHNLIVWKLPLISEDEEDSVDDELPEASITYDINDPSNPFLVKVLLGHTQSVRSVSAYGNIIVSGSYDGTVRVWDLLDNANCKHVLTGHSDRIYSTALDFQNKLCYSGSMDSTIHIWDFEKGDLLHSLEGHASLVGLLELSKDYLVSAAADSTLRVWNPKSGENYSKLEGHTAAITCFQHDCLRIVSGSERLLKLWDIKTGKFVRDLLADVTGGIWQVSFDFNICVAAVQRNINDKEETFLELLDFSIPQNGE